MKGVSSPYEIVDGEDNEEYEYDLVDDPRVRIHPVTGFRKEGLRSLTDIVRTISRTTVSSTTAKQGILCSRRVLLTVVRVREIRIPFGW